MPRRWFNKGLHELALGNIDWVNDTIKIMACDSFSLDVDAHEFIDDVSGNEITATGYTAGGATLGTKSISRDDANDKIWFKAANVTWTITGTMTAQVFIIYLDTGTPGTSPILGYVDKGSPQARTDEDFVVEFSNGNVLSLSSALQ